MANTQDLMDKVVALAKRRGFIFPSSEIYGGLANTYDYGPLGVELKNNIKNLWWERFVHRRDDIVGIDAALIMNPRVWEASGHLDEFSDPLLECDHGHRFKEDEVSREEKKQLICPICGVRGLKPPRQFNLMFKTFFGPAEDASTTVYLRPETAQAMFVDFKNILDSTRVSLPFGIAQVGKAFRNEITPSNFIFRTREFEMMEIEYFIPPPSRDEDWQKYFNEWRDEMTAWMEEIGVNLKKVHEVEIPEGERAHYSKRTIDFEYEFPFGQNELYGLAYRTDFDLRAHFKDPPYRDPDPPPGGGQEFWPHVIEPSWGVDRTVLVMLLEAYDESDPERIVLHLKPQLAPYKAAVFPLLANKPELVNLARSVYNDLRSRYPTAWDDRGNIGKRYYAQDEIGTPYCVTIDHQSLENKTVTIRDRNTTKQERVAVQELASVLEDKIKK